MMSPTNGDKHIYPPALGLGHVCRCNGEVSDEDLHYDGHAMEFEDEPCQLCGGRVISSPPPVWMAEEEDDC